MEFRQKEEEEDEQSLDPAARLLTRERRRRKENSPSSRSEEKRREEEEEKEEEERRNGDGLGLIALLSFPSPSFSPLFFSLPPIPFPLGSDIINVPLPPANLLFLANGGGSRGDKKSPGTYFRPVGSQGTKTPTCAIANTPPPFKELTQRVHLMKGDRERN